MSGKFHVTGDKMSVVDFSDPVFAGKSARIMARDLLHKVSRGPGDTLARAAGQIEDDFGVEAEIIMQGWHREPRPMMTHRWLPLFLAWIKAGCVRIDAAYEEERSLHDADSALVRLADLVAGKKSSGD